MYEHINLLKVFPSYLSHQSQSQAIIESSLIFMGAYCCYNLYDKTYYCNSIALDIILHYAMLVDRVENSLWSKLST